MHNGYTYLKCIGTIKIEEVTEQRAIYGVCTYLKSRIKERQTQEVSVIKPETPKLNMNMQSRNHSQAIKRLMVISI